MKLFRVPEELSKCGFIRLIKVDIMGFWPPRDVTNVNKTEPPWLPKNFCIGNPSKNGARYKSGRLRLSENSSPIKNLLK
jgi:hypothetical protein